MAHQLTSGAIHEMYWNCNSQNPGSSILQIMDIKKIGSMSGQNSERFRVTISDGQSYSQAMLATQLNSLVTEKKLEKNSLIEVKESICNTVQSRRIVILLQIEPRGTAPGVIGDPVNIENQDPAAAATVKSGSQTAGRAAHMSPGSNPSTALFNKGAGQPQPQNQPLGWGAGPVKQEYSSSSNFGGNEARSAFDRGRQGGGMGNQSLGGSTGQGYYDSHGNSSANNTKFNNYNPHGAHGGQSGQGGGGGGGGGGGRWNAGGSGSGYDSYQGGGYQSGPGGQGRGSGGGGGGDGGFNDYQSGGGAGGGGYNNAYQHGQGAGCESRGDGGRGGEGGFDSYHAGGGTGGTRYAKNYSNSSNMNNNNNFQGCNAAAGSFGGRGGGGDSMGSYDNPRQGGRGRGGVVETLQSGGRTQPIMQLQPFVNGFTIVARLISKSSVRTYKNQKGEGRVASIELMDQSGDIKGTFFNDECDRWIPQLAVNSVYRISGGQIKKADRRFNQSKSEYEITFGRDTTFEPLSDADAPKVQYNFVSIEEIERLDPGCIVDILVLVQRADPVGSITVKSGANAGNQVAKREVVLVDRSQKTIKLTLWDDHIHLVDENDTAAKCLAVKGVRISDFGGRSLSTMRNSMAEVSPDLPAAHALRGWYEHVGKKENFTSLSGGGGGPKRSKFISDIKSENLGHEKPEYFSLRCWVTYIKHEGTFCYVANPENKKKVVQQGDNWFDESLNKVIDNPERRYVMSLSVSDHTGSHWLSAFNEQGLVLLGGTTADELWEYKEHDDPRFAWTFNKHMFKPYNMRIRAKVETWQDEARVKCNIQEIEPLDWKKGSDELLALIREFRV